ncbi:LytR/AlgR family response regulator transcription factor [Foetidibacter luteolus]|uniref:LytR/AlgR family response regulator transcription factor n=1 Tax=Foetidibacter luteolus TaxID=2608880 RepID=UPI001A9A1761|nr:LytTR family DNA-binding domain-containing protein [Foetidibacter luteolus]
MENTPNAGKAAYLLPHKSHATSQGFIFVKSEYKLIKTNIADILYAEGMKDYIKFHLQDGSFYTTLQSLNYYEQRLQHSGFFRVHRSFLVNIFHISCISKNEVQIGKLFIPVGTAYRKQFLDALEGYQ